MTRLPDPSVATGWRPAADQFGRVARDLRVSVTDRCNLRCTYCMPAEGLPWMPKAEMLTDEEMLRHHRPLRPRRRDAGAPDRRGAAAAPVARRPRRRHRRARAASAHRHDDQRRGPRAGGARARQAGLDRVNVSLDTIDSETFTQLTRRDRLADVEARPQAAAEAGLTPVKVNAVAMRGINDESVADVLAWCLERGYELRFIEQMPLDAQHAWDRSDMITADEIRERLSRRLGADAAARGGAGERPGRALPHRRRAGDRGHHRERDARRSVPPATAPG